MKRAGGFLSDFKSGPAGLLLGGGVLALLFLTQLLPAQDAPAAADKKAETNEAAAASDAGQHAAPQDDDTAKQDDDTAKQDEDTAKQDEDSAKKDEDTAKQDEDTAKQDEDSAKKDDGQDKDAAKEKKDAAKADPDTAKPDSAKPATEPQSAAKPADGAAAAAEYQAKLSEWKGVLKELRALKLKFDMADAKDVPAIREQWNEQIARGEALIPQLREAGAKAYAAAPGVDRELENFLVKLLKDDVESDRFEPGAELGYALLDAGCEVKEVLDLTGVAAFCVNEYDRAEKYLKAADSAGVLSDIGRKFLSIVPEYRKLWAEELAIRQKEAEQDDLPRVKMTTNKGEMVIELFENEAPATVGNFISLIEKGFYDGLVFHRVLQHFMAQGGCPQGTGSGGPGYEIYCECYEPHHRKHFRGTLSMAHRGRDTGGSQFFLTFVPTDHLNGLHTAFGRVIEGMDVLSKLQRIDPEDKEHKPVPDKIVKMEVLRKRPHEYKPNKVQ